MSSKPVSVKSPIVWASIVVALAASLMCGVQPAWAVEEVQYVEKSWDAESKQVVSETKTAQAAALTSDTEYINGWCYVSGTIEGSKRLTVMGGQEANIILTDGSKLTLEKGVNVHWTSKLNIYAQQGETGELICYADANKENAPIGSDNDSGPNGSITIHGGKITANNDNDKAHAAGIGAGKTGAGGTITIYGGTIEARGGNGSAGIGGGDAYGPGRDGGTITIYGGDVKAYGGGGAAGIGGGRGGNGGAITIWGGKVYAKGGPQSSYSFPNDSGAGIGSGDDDAGSTATTGGTIGIYGGEVEAYGGPDAAGIGGGDGCIGGCITIAGGTVKATGGSCASGIGAGDDTDGGVNASIINITGGTIEATGGKHGAGVGGGEGGGGGIINVSGGAVTASAGSDAAGIGGGKGGNGDSVTISGGTVVATGNAGGAGVGGGDRGAGTNIIISGGTVEAIGGANGSGIGNGEGGTGMATTVKLKYAEDEYDISVKATSYRCNNEDTSVTLTMENPFMDKGTREAFAATSYTAANLDTLNNKTLVRASTFGVTVSEAQGGSVVVGKSRAVPGSTVTLTVAPDAGSWELKPGTLKAKAGETELALTQDTSDSSKYTFTMPTADVTVTAEFVKKVAVESVSLNKEETTLVVDGTETLVATVLPKATDTTMVDTTVTWKSSDESVATVDEAGKVTAVAPGEATITATATNGTEDAADDKTATCTVTVSKAANPLSFDETQDVGKVYSTEVQEADLAAATGGQGEVTYSLVSQKDAADADVSHFTIDGTTLALAAGTPAGTYTVVVRATAAGNDGYDEGSKDSTVTVTVAKAMPTPPETPAPEAVTYDPAKTLADVALPEGWAWVVPDTIPTVGNEGYRASLAVDDENYDYSGDESYDAEAHTVKRTVQLTVNKAEVAAPAIASKTYKNGENQTADVPASDLYDVTANDGGINAGEYDVVLTLKDAGNYKWADSGEAAKTLKFQITPADIEPAVSIQGWTYGEEANEPTVKGNPGNGDVAYEYKARDAGDEAYAGTVPADAGEYTVRASVAEAGNYKAGSATAQFAIAKAKAPGVTTPAPEAVAYDPDKTLADVELPEGWAWADDSIVPTVANEGYQASLAVDDANYDYAGVEGYDPETHKVTRTVPLAVGKAAATPATVTANNRAWDGTSKPLAEAEGEAEGGSMLYALGEDAETAPAQGWGSAVPTATGVGTYHVWYKVAGDANHSDSEPACVTATVSHKFTEVAEVPATCTEPGVARHWVDETGALYSDAEGAQPATEAGLAIAALGHDWGERKVVKEATEAEEGAEERTCARCGETQTRAIPAKGHVHGLTKVDAKAATCTEPGNIEYWTCTEGESPCRRYFADAEGAVEIEPEDTVVPALGHEWGAWAVTTQPTCTEPGAEARTCAHDASHVETRELAALGHEWGEPSYEWAAGNGTVTATRVCRNDAAHVETETAEAASAVTEEPTEAEEGVRTFTAAFSNPAFATQTKTAPIPKLAPADPGDDPQPRTDPDPDPDPGTDPGDEPAAPTYANTAGDGAAWTKGGTATADFTFKRSVGDEQTFGHFVGIRVDGEDVDPASYTAEAGSVVVRLKPAYLETLSVGQHTLIALFDDGNNPTAKFTIVAAPVPTPDPQPQTDPQPTPGPTPTPDPQPATDPAPQTDPQPAPVPSDPDTTPAARPTPAPAPANATPVPTAAPAAVKATTARTSDGAAPATAAVLLAALASAACALLARRRAE